MIEKKNIKYPLKNGLFITFQKKFSREKMFQLSTVTFQFPHTRSKPNPVSCRFEMTCKDLVIISVSSHIKKCHIYSNQQQFKLELIYLFKIQLMYQLMINQHVYPLMHIFVSDILSKKETLVLYPLHLSWCSY